MSSLSNKSCSSSRSRWSKMFRNRPSRVTKESTQSSTAPSSKGSVLRRLRSNNANQPQVVAAPEQAIREPLAPERVDYGSRTQTEEQPIVAKANSSIIPPRPPPSSPKKASISSKSTSPKTKNSVKRFFAKDKDTAPKKLVYKSFGDVATDVLRVETLDELPQPETDTQVVIKVQASTVSLMDTAYRRGLCLEMLNPICLPATPGEDVVGTICSVGSAVQEFQLGDRVAALVKVGGNARYTTVESDRLVRVPKSLPADEATCLIANWMTAYQSMQLVCPLFKSLSGKKVLVTGGGGPLGQALIQLAKRAGASKIFTTMPQKLHGALAKVTSGATPLPVEPQQWLPLVEGQMDVVFDSACHDGYDSSQKALTDNGSLVCVGVYGMLQSHSMSAFGAPLSAYFTQFKASTFMSQTQTYEVHDSFAKDPERFKDDLEHLFILLKKREIRPTIVKRVGLSGVAQAHHFIEHGKAMGSVVCLPWRKANNQDEHAAKQLHDEASTLSIHSWYKR